MSIRQRCSAQGRRGSGLAYWLLLLFAGALVASYARYSIAESNTYAEAQKQARIAARDFTESVPRGCDIEVSQNDKVPEGQPNGGTDIIEVSAEVRPTFTQELRFPDEPETRNNLLDLGEYDRAWFTASDEPLGFPDTLIGAYLRLEGVERLKAISPSCDKVAYAVELANGNWEVRTNFDDRRYPCNDKVSAIIMNDRITCFATENIQKDGAIYWIQNDTGSELIARGIGAVRALVLDPHRDDIVYFAPQRSRAVCKMNIGQFALTSRMISSAKPNIGEISGLEFNESNKLVVSGSERTKVLSSTDFKPTM